MLLLIRSSLQFCYFVKAHYYTCLSAFETFWFLITVSHKWPGFAVTVFYCNIGQDITLTVDRGQTANVASRRKRALGSMLDGIDVDIDAEPVVCEYKFYLCHSL